MLSPSKSRRVGINGAQILKGHHILFVNTPTYLGGAEISLLLLMQHLNADHYSPFLLTSGEGALLDAARAMGIPAWTQEFPWFSRRRPWRYAGSILELTREIRSKQIELVHCNCDHSLRYVMHACRLTAVPYVCHVRDFVRTWFRPEKLAALNQAVWVIAPSIAAAKACIEAGVHQKRVVPIYDAIDLDAFREVQQADRGRVRMEFAIPSDALVIGIVGQIQSLKGHLEFAEVALRLAAAIPNLYFLIVGTCSPLSADQAYFADLKARIEASRYSTRFRFAGFRSDIPSVMKALDILAVPSWTESFGRVAAEGMAAGRAVVGTRVGGLSEIIADDVNGLLVPPKDVEALFAALQRLTMNSRLRIGIAESAQQSVQRFSITNHVAQVQSLYESILSAPGFA